MKDSLKEKLKDKLREIFQFESEDLDFGIYRIMNYKRKEIEKFVEEELINEVKKQLELLGEEERKRIEEKLEEVSSKNGVKKYLEALKRGDKERARIYREDFKEHIEEYERLKRELEEIKISEELEKQIYNHLVNFFSRYYDKGDFISKRRYGKNEKYIIPYNGEEVLLYWANKDQHYIKTTEYFRKYAFKVKRLIVNFRVVEAEEEKGNIKSPEKKFFVLNEKVFNFDKEKREINIYFEYRGLTEEEEEKYKHGRSVSQDKINEEIIEMLKDRVGEEFKELFKVINKEKNDYKKYLLGKHLYKYTRRNTTDYFIHKDLKGFLERELDFYIKNEFLQLEDLQVLEQSGYFDKLRLYLIGVRAFRKIALKIIEFLAQIENFQKKIWEKKKFVIETHYVITLDKIKEYVGEEFLESILGEVLSNKKQLEEWKELFGIEVKKKEDLIERDTLQGKEWRKLPIDTKYFDEEFKWKLLVALTKDNDLDEILDGVLIKSENWQALNLLLNKYYEKVQTIYIDPPYNTGSDDFLYKDSYQHSSWLTMMENRLNLAKHLLKSSGALLTSIDDNELYNLKNLIERLGLSFISNLIWKSKSGGAGDAAIAVDTEYILFFAKDSRDVLINKMPIRRDYPYKDDKFKKWSGFNVRSLDETGIRYTKTLDFPIIIDPKKKVIVVDGESIPISDKMFLDFHIDDLNKEIVLLPGGSKNYTKKYTWRWKKDKIIQGLLKAYLVFSKKRNGKIKLLQKQYEKFDTTKEKMKELDTTPYRNWYDKSNTGFGRIELTSLFGFDIYPYYPKNTELIVYLLKMDTSKDNIVIDFFAGSGTTAHAVMKLNKEDDGKRKFILVEMADYFDTVIIPRIKKVAYSLNWKDGKPQDADGIGVFFKYHTLEQYEDALENIEFEQPQKTLYELTDYFVKYMLEWETKKSKTFLNIDEMKDPFNYKLKIIENYQQKVVNVDLVETFNYFLGLNVSKYRVIEENGRRYVFVFGEREGRRIAIVWRSIKHIDFEKDKKIIEENLKDYHPDEIYINGEALVKGFKHIEPLFKSLMFEKKG